MVRKRNAAPIALVALGLATVLAACAGAPIAPDSTPPDAPNGFSSERLDGALGLRWDLGTEADLANYRLSLREGLPAATAAVAPAQFEPIAELPATTGGYTVDGLANDRFYDLELVAVDRSGNVSDAASLSARPGDAIAPAAPTGVAATPGEGEVTIGWDAGAEPDLAEYLVILDPMSDAPNVVGVVPAGSEQWVEGGLANGVEVAFAVRSVDTSGNRSELSPVVTATPTDATAPGFPTGVEAIAGDGEAFVSWDPAPEADVVRYDIFQGTVSGALSRAAEVPVGSESYQATGLTNGTTYHFAVEAVDSSDNASPRSVEASATPAPVVTLATLTGVIQAKFTTLWLWRGADPIEGAQVSLNGTDAWLDNGGTYKIELPISMDTGDPVALSVAYGAESIAGSATLPTEVVVSAPSDGSSVSSGDDVAVAWSVAEEPDAYFIQVTCVDGACSHPADTLKIDLPGDASGTTLLASDLVVNGVYTIRVDSINLLALSGDHAANSEVRVSVPLAASGSPTFQVIP